MMHSERRLLKPFLSLTIDSFFLSFNTPSHSTLSIQAPSSKHLTLFPLLAVARPPSQHTHTHINPFSHLSTSTRAGSCVRLHGVVSRKWRLFVR